VRQLLIEGSVLAVVGGALGLGLALAGIALFRSAIPENALPYWFDYSPDARVIAALVLVSVATIFVFALLPAVQASRTDLNRVTKDAGRGTSGSRAARRWSTAFLTAEFALAVVLLAQTAMSIRGRRPPLPSDDAIEARQLVTASVTLSGERYRTPQQRMDFYRLLNERLRAVPEVSSMAVAGVAPLMGGSDAGIDIAGRPPADPAAPRTAKIVAVGPRYFETLALPLVRGRELLDSDGAGDHPSAVVVNQEFARQVLGEADPIGQRVALRGMSAPAGAPRWSTVVGLSLDIRQRPGADPEPVVYVAYAADPSPTATLLVRSRGDAGSLAARLKDEVAALDANLPLDRVRTMAEVIWNARWNARLSYRLILTLTLIAVGLSTVGLYAVTMHAVSQRTQEIGVRMALGARPRQVVAMIVRGALVQLGFGLAAGIVCTRLWTGLLPSGSPDVSITDPGSLALVAAVLAVASALACVAPARRATRLDPVAAMRHE
jgi:putative ABC transport system permease protein